MATYEIKNVSGQTHIWSELVINPNQSIEITYQNLYDKTAGMGNIQDAFGVSALAQQNILVLLVDGVQKSQEETLRFIAELHNKNCKDEIPTRFICPSN